MVALGIVALIAWVAWQINKGAKVSMDTLFMAALVGIPSGVIVSRLLHVLDKWSYYSQHWNEIIGGDGLTIYGAILGAALGIWVYSKISRVKFGLLADLITPGLIIAQMIGRVGCIINGCCYGDVCDLPWAIVYTHPETFGPAGIPVHTTQADEIIYLLAAFAIILFLKDRIRPHGSLFAIYLSLYAVWRILVDFIREGTPFLFGLHEAQVIGIVTLLVTIPLLAMKTRWGKAEEEPEPVPAASDTPPETSEKLPETPQIPDKLPENAEENPSDTGE
jgi:phosphatidylglycerol:prolipoprotein diacylglycerol transferase